MPPTSGNLCCGCGADCMDDPCSAPCNPAPGICPDNFCGAQKVSTLAAGIPAPDDGDGSGASIASYGVQPPGLYYLMYCDGAFLTFAPTCCHNILYGQGGDSGRAATQSDDCGPSCSSYGYGWGDPLNPVYLVSYQPPVSCGPADSSLAFSILYVGCDLNEKELGGIPGFINSGQFLQSAAGLTFTLGGGFTTAAAAAAELAGIWTSFIHYGGEIKLKYVFTSHATIVGQICPECAFVVDVPCDQQEPDCCPPATPQWNYTALEPFIHAGAPRFALYHSPMPAVPPAKPKICFASACASWALVGALASVTFTVHNHNCWCWGAITASLSVNNAAPITLAPQVIPGLDDGTFAFVFPANKVGVTVTLTLASPEWTAPIVFKVFLAPVLQVVLTRHDFPSNTCGPNVDIGILNRGNWTVNPATVDLTFSDGYGMRANLIDCITAVINPVMAVRLDGPLICNGGYTIINTGNHDPGQGNVGEILLNAHFTHASQPPFHNGQTTITATLQEAAQTYIAAPASITF